MGIEKKDITRVLREMATLLELAGAGHWEVMAYRNGADNVWDWPGDLEAAVTEGTVTDIPGIGKGLGRVITQLVESGRSEDHQELLSRFPPGLPDVLLVPGLGPRKVKALHEELDVGSLEELEQAIAEGRVRTLKGFGKKTEESILAGIPRARERRAARRF